MSIGSRVAGTGLAAAALALLIIWLGSGSGESGAGAAASSPARTLPAARCAVVARGLQGLRSAVAAAPAGAVVCLADGSYGTVELESDVRSPGVTVRAEHPGRATIAGAELGGSHLRLSRFDIAGDVEVEPGTVGVRVSRNRISGGYFGVDAGPTTTTPVGDVAIVGNKFVGPFGEDAIRLNRYHDADGNGVGALVAGNEFTNVRENGNHSDCLQTVWVGDHLVFRGNYLHDNRCQGFFVKDQASPVRGIVVENNLFLRNEAPCVPSDSGCGAPADLQVFGPYARLVMRGNTIWGREAVAVFQNGGGPHSAIVDNVIYKLWTSTDLSSFVYRNNTRCRRQTVDGGSWPAARPGEAVDCDPAFVNARRDDYRLVNGRGVDWKPATRHFGF